MNSKFVLPIIAIVTLSVAIGVNAAGKGRNMNSANQMPVFSEMDIDNDELVSLDEFNAFRADRIAQKTAEGRMLRNISSSPMFENLDSNGDQFIDQSEYQAMPCNNNYRQGKNRGKGQNRLL